MSRKNIYFGTGAGVNWIPTEGENAREINLRSLLEMAEAGVRDLQMNFFLQCYYDLDNYDAYLSLADELGLHITFLFREVEAIHEMRGGVEIYHDVLGMMTMEEIEKACNHFVYSKTGIIRDGKIEDILDCNDAWMCNSQTGNLVSVSGYCYPRVATNPFDEMTEFSELIKYEYSGGHRGKYKFSAEGLQKLNEQAYTLLFEIRTARFWVVAPVWDDEYYERIYKGRHIKTIAEKCKFKSHPSVKCISTINEPTLTWAGGDVIKSPDWKKHWTNFLKKDYSDEIETLNVAFDTKYGSFEEVEYFPRLIYSGGYHTHWSGVPGRGFNSEYEIAKARFKHYLMLIYYERTYKAVKELCGDFPVMVKYNWLNIDKMGEQGSGSYMSADSKWLDIIGWDMYPLWLGLGNLTPISFSGTQASENTKKFEETQPDEYVPTYTSTAAALPLLSKSNDKPGWAAETACGASKTLPEFTAKLTELSFTALLKMGIDQVHYWAVGPWNRGVRKVEDPYAISEVKKENRIRPSLSAIGKVTQQLKNKRFDIPEFDIFLAYPEKNVVLYNATDDGQEWVNCRKICEQCHAKGILSTDEVLLPHLAHHVKSIAFYNGIYLSDKDREFINHTKKPVILLGHAFPTNPPFDICYDTLADRTTNPFSIDEKFELKLPDGEVLHILSFESILPSKGITPYAHRRYKSRDYTPFFSIGNRLIFGITLNNPNDYVKIIRWWLREQKIISQ